MRRAPVMQRLGEDLAAERAALHDRPAGPQRARWPRAGSPVFQLIRPEPSEANTRPGELTKAAAGLATRGADHGGSASATGAATSSVRAVTTAMRIAQRTGVAVWGCGV